MSASEKQIKEAFDAIAMPPGLKEDTLAMIATQEVQPAPRVKKQRPKLYTRRMGFALAACLLLCAIGFGGFTAYATETAVVGIEMNPSIELGLNRFDTVVAVRALNEDGERVVESTSLIGKSYDEAMELLTQNKVFQSYADADAFVNIYVLCDDKRQSTDLVNRGQQQIEALPYSGSCHWVSSETKDEADAHGMGVSRYQAAEVLVSLDPTLTIEDCASMRMSELRARIAEIDPTNEFASHHGGAGMGNGNGNGMGNGAGHGAGSGAGAGNGNGAGAGDGTGNGTGGGSGNGTGNGAGAGNGNGTGHGNHGMGRQGKGSS